MKKFFLLSFVPTSADLGLLVLRLGLGLPMLLLHGWVKVQKFETMFNTFPDPLGLGSRASYLLATGGEFLGSALLILGLCTRAAAVWLAIIMGVAFFMAHGGALSGPRSGELALIFGVGFVTLLVAGGGRFSLDRSLGGR
jgi:putative oxidoreductase